MGRRRTSVELGRGWRELARQVLFVGSGILFYFGVRGLTEGSVDSAIENGENILALEERFGIAIEMELQQWTERVPFLTTLSNWVYIWLHWPVIIVSLIWLHHARAYEYLILRNAMFLSGAVGLIIFTTFPVAPPRLIGAGFVDTVTDLSTSYRVLQPPNLVNKYAAVPSLHVGWNLLVGLVVFRATTNRMVRVLAVVTPLLMTIAVMTTANHYLIDAVLGAAIALAGLLVATKFTVRIALVGRQPEVGPDEPDVVENDAVDPEFIHQRDGLGVVDGPREDKPAPLETTDDSFRK